MARFYTGDELGNLKSITCTQETADDNTKSWAFDEKVLQRGLTGDTARAVQKLVIHISDGSSLLAASRLNGDVSTYAVAVEGALSPVQELKETRFKPGQEFVGLSMNSRGIFWCTSNGALASSPLPGTDKDTSAVETHKATLPMHLCAWRQSPDAQTFAYGGNEVDLSVWNTERAFLSSSETNAIGTESVSKKRKRAADLLPGEIWRAKNLPNNALSLRQSIHITSLTYLPSTSASSIHIVTGTQKGDVRRYDTRTARRPVADWKGIGKVGGISVIEVGAYENELFVSDNGTTLSTLDLRNGRILYSYKKLAGAVNSFAPAPSESLEGFLASTAHDRFFRLHSTYPPPVTEGVQQDNRGEVLGSVYMKSTPTAVVFDSRTSRDTRGSASNDSESDEEDEEMWAAMQEADESDEDGGNDRRRGSKNNRGNATS